MSTLTTSGVAWPAPVAGGPLDAVVPVPGSKSLTNRYLLLAAIAAEPTQLHRPLHSRDSALMVDALRALGVRVEHVDADGRPDPEGPDLLIDPAPLHGPARVDCGLAGTVMRFVPPLAALADGAVEFDGDPRARERPMGALIDALRDLGAQVDDDGRAALPFTVHGTGGLPGGTVEVDASASSQFVSGLLLVAPALARGLDLRRVGPMPSQPHVAMTVEVLRERGVEVEVTAGEDGEPGRWRVQPGPVAGGLVPVEPDLSNAGPFLAAALVAGGSVRVPDWPTRTAQAGDRLRELLVRMGATVELGPAGLTVTGSGSVQPLDVDLHDAGELTPVVAALCTLADGPSRIRGVAHLRGHETDRIAALATEINRLGGTARETDDGLEIEPGVLRPARLETYADHRMAHFAAVVGLRLKGTEIVDVATTSKTLPDFTGMWTDMVATGGRG
ncbi:3-phosphoshikimate 1-carboxyvinyltransferase [uncultured Georgenia sp.]|uniref:3-phosphoshikimate 1-carboxyvinyltransferase n=1 Tax=uncultured Georgenia sp. TaxID=378209 RepID=UPI0026049540|nr:3-phosphoshikimate 1-carboxyvinyltransferase [uncultured Georgenia sp.]HLV05366.1 3-phosphoshikimate 1-carboxyvinyltransferase [Actinomycetaceae bacterium]